MESQDKDMLKKVGGYLVESMASVFSMLTGKDFDLKAQDPNILDLASVAGLNTGQAIFVKALYQKGIQGPIFFVMPFKESTQLVDLMLGGDGAPADELVGDGRDALAETFNQVMGSANQSLSDLAGETLSISNVEVFAQESSPGSVEPVLGSGKFLAQPISLGQEGIQATLHVLFPEALALQMKRKLGFAEPAIQAAKAPEPAPAAPTASSASQSAPPSRPAASAPMMAMAAPMPMMADQGNLELLLDIELPLVVRMGQTEMPLGELLKLTPGAIIELNRAADSPVDLLVNGKQIARGEVVVVDGNFAFRVTEIESTATRIRSLG